MSLRGKHPRRPILCPAGNTFSHSHTSSKVSKKEVVSLVKNRHDRNRSGGVIESARSDTLAFENSPMNSYPDSTGCCAQDDASTDSFCSSDSSSAKKSASSGMKVINQNGTSLGTAEPEKPLSHGQAAIKRCHWITPHSDQMYITFHDKEWGVPVHDDNRLFELLVYSQALAELSWPAILHKRDAFRKHFDDFDAASVAHFTDAKLIPLETLLSKPKVEAAVENAHRIVKVQQEFGSLNNYCWNFVNHRSIRNNIRYANQVPTKSPKALLISKDMMQRGFRCVGPTVVYSFMEAAGMVNDHLVSCFRYKECISKNMKIHALENEETVS